MSDEEWDTSLEAHDYVALVYCYVACVIVTFIAGVFMREIYKSNTGQQSSDREKADDIKLITRASIAAIFLYSLSTILLSIAFTKWIVIDQKHGIVLNYTLVHGMAMTPYFCNLMAVVPFILLQRLNRILANRRIHIFSFVALIFGVIVVPLMQSVIYIVGLSNAETIRLITALFTMLCLIMYLVVAFMYLHQISKVMKSRIKSRMFEMDDKKESDAPVVSVVSFETVKDTVRCALLVMICALSNLLMPVMGFMSLSITRHPTHISTLTHIGAFTDIICNTVCIFLLFRFAEKYYFYWCKPCHACTMRCCERKVVKWYGNTDSRWTEKDYESLIAEDLVTSDRNRQ